MIFLSHNFFEKKLFFKMCIKISILGLQHENKYITQKQYEMFI